MTHTYPRNDGNIPIIIEYDELIRSTEKAYLLIIEGDPYWIPKSQVEELDKDNMTITIPEWLTKEKGLLY